MLECFCGSRETQTDASSGDVVCAMCGEVLEQAQIVNEVAFMQSSSGRVGLVGQRVSLSESQNQGILTTIERGGVKTEWIGNRLGLKAFTIDEAKRMFALAAHRNFTAGRKTSHVAAACLYIVCRRDRAPVMLLDFSDIVCASVRQLGQVYMKLVRLLNLEKVLDIPVIDPSLFMERFASKLSLGQLEHKITHTAVRLIQVMSRDWISTGRRPTGLCGAALLIACRAHGADKDAEEIAQVVRIGQVTIKRRLYELKNTSTAALTFENFEQLQDLVSIPEDHEALPPALIRNRAKEAKLQARLALESPPPSPSAAAPLQDVSTPPPPPSEGDASSVEEPDGVHIANLAETVVASFGSESLAALLESFQAQADVPSAHAAADAAEEDSDLELLDDHEADQKRRDWETWSQDWLAHWELRQEQRQEHLRKRKHTDISTSRRLPPQQTPLEATKLAIQKKSRYFANNNLADLDGFFTR